MEEYLTVAELSKRIKFSKQSIYNLINKKIFIRGKHYLKPRPKKILFKWSEIMAWMEQCAEPISEEPTDPESSNQLPEQPEYSNLPEKSKSLINI